MRKAFNATIVLLPVLGAALLLAWDLGHPPDGRMMLEASGPSGQIAVQAGSQFDFSLPAGGEQSLCAELASAPSTSPALATFEVCAAGSCHTALVDMRPGVWAEVPLDPRSTGTVSVRCTELRGGPAWWTGHGGIPDVRVRVPPSWSYPLERARRFYAAYGLDLFWPSLTAYALALGATVAIAIRKLRQVPP